MKEGNAAVAGRTFRLIQTIGKAPSRAGRFVLRQKPSYRVTVTRAAFSSFLAGLTT